MNIIVGLLTALLMAIVVVGVGGGLIWLLERKHRNYQKKDFKVGDKITFASDYIYDAEILSEI